MTNADVTLLIQAGFHHEIQDWEDGETPDSHSFYLGDIEIGETVATCPQPWVVLRTGNGEVLGHGELVECIAIAKKRVAEADAEEALDAALREAGCDDPWQFISPAWAGKTTENARYAADPRGYVAEWLDAWDRYVVTLPCGCRTVHSDSAER